MYLLLLQTVFILMLSRFTNCIPCSCKLCLSSALQTVILQTIIYLAYCRLTNCLFPYLANYHLANCTVSYKLSSCKLSFPLSCKLSFCKLHCILQIIFLQIVSSLYLVTLGYELWSHYLRSGGGFKELLFSLGSS